MLSQYLLKELFEYNKDTGILYRKKTMANAIKNCVVGCLNGSGYLMVEIDKKRYLLHRVIYMYCYGYLPKSIDHIDRNKTNNKIDNLRPCNDQQNQYNTGLSKTNKSGYKGVSWHKLSKKWQAKIRFKNKQIYLGLFDNINEAAEAYNKAAELYGKEFASINIVIKYD